MKINRLFFLLPMNGVNIVNLAHDQLSKFQVYPYQLFENMLLLWRGLQSTQ